MTAALAVRQAGPFTTLQDLGRPAFQHVGVPPSGALDWISLRLANALVGNPQDTAAIEILHVGPTLEVQCESVRIALAGSDAGIEVLGEEPRLIAPWRSVLLRRGETFRIGSLSDSACCYLAVAGGFAVEPCLASCSTYVRSGFGGFAGRLVQVGDLLPLRRAEAPDREELALPRSPDAELRSGEPIRVVLGPQDDYFTDAALEAFTGDGYVVSRDADRMGMRLDGPSLQHKDSYNIVSDGIATGAIQVPGNGRPIVLLVDRQTTGGYPKIATVISADLPGLGRRRPGDAVRFAAVSLEEAEDARRALERRLEELANKIEPVSDRTIDIESLYSQNLISGVVSGCE